MYIPRSLFIMIFIKFVYGYSVYRNDWFELPIIHYNDFHARFEETSISFPVCTSNDSTCIGGFARLYQEIHTLLEEKPDALLLNAGDTFQGTYWYTLLKWNVTQKFINLLPNDAHAIGNHEFDDGIKGIVPYLKSLKAPVIAANMDTSKEPSMDGLYRSHIVIERKGRKIGIIGLTTTESKTTSNPGKIRFLDPIKTAQKEAQLLTDQGVDIIIVLSHCGLTIDKKIANISGENIDVIVGGHSHSLLYNGTSPSKEEISGPYPIFMSTEAQPDHKVLIVTASAFTKYVGNLTVYFDKKGDVKDFDGTAVFLNRSIPEDPKIKAIMKPYLEELHTLTSEVIGFAEDDFSSEKCASQECALGDFIAEGYLNATKEMNVSSLPHVAFLVRNLIRGSIQNGEITRGDIINAIPISNKVVTFSILGRHLLEVFKICMSNSWVAKPFVGPWMPQVAGLRVIVNLTTDVSIKVLVKDEDYTEINPENFYQVTTVNFLTNGHNAFKVLHDQGHNQTEVGLDRDIAERYLKIITPISATLDKRLIIIN